MGKFSLIIIIIVVSYFGFAAWQVNDLIMLGNTDTKSPNLSLETIKSLYKKDISIPYPDNNPYSKAKYKLGKILFFDPRLSDTGAISCATCHNPVFSWTDSFANAKGKEHKDLPRKTMSLFNLAWDDLYLWDGRLASLEEQVEEALTAPLGMNNNVPELVEKISSINGYRELFRTAFENDHEMYKKNNYINIDSIKAAIATFERGIVSRDSSFDEWIKGDENAISAGARRGFELFNGKAKCADCHTGWRFSDGKFHKIGVRDLDKIDIGHGITNSADKSLLWKFKAVGLRNIDQRPPYMHNGSLNTLEEVIEFYNRGGDFGPGGSEITALNLTDSEKNDLLEFLKTLTAENDPEVVLPLMPR